MPFDPQRHHRHSIRLKGWDYRSAGIYYVTIVTKGNVYLFGNVECGRVVLNEVGKIVEDEWLKTPIIRPYVELDEFVIMPNHLHGIIIIKDELEIEDVSKSGWEMETGGAHSCAPVLKRMPHSLGSIIAGFKSAAAKRINIYRNSSGMAVWHRNYYEHIVRDYKSLERIREYIINNPMKWEMNKRQSDDFGIQE